jgi:ribosomal protein L11 methyltransferase
MTAWLELSVEVPAGMAERTSERLDELGAVAVTFVGAGADEVLEPLPGEQPLWAVVRLEALFEIEADLRSIRQGLEAAGARVLDVTLIEDADWQERWRAHAVRQRFGDRLWVVPRDEPLPEDANATGGAPLAVLRLDPGLAFGTGSHPTTRLCLTRLATLGLRGRRVLDFGCGSGILALAACLLGAREVVAIDHDPQALAATRDNAQYNGVGADQLRVGDQTLLDAAGVDAGSFDVVVANILANPLVELASLLTRLLAPGGALVLSGLLVEQEGIIRSAYPGVRFAPAVVEEEWIRLDGTVG